MSRNSLVSLIAGLAVILGIVFKVDIDAETQAALVESIVMLSVGTVGVVAVVKKVKKKFEQKKNPSK